MNHEIDEFFEHTTMSFYREVEVQGKKYSENFDQHVITVNDISGLIEKIILERDLSENNVLVRIGLDGGGGFAKICLSLFDLDQEASSYSQNVGKMFKDSEVKKVFIISTRHSRVLCEYQENVDGTWSWQCTKKFYNRDRFEIMQHFAGTSKPFLHASLLLVRCW